MKLGKLGTTVRSSVNTAALPPADVKYLDIENIEQHDIRLMNVLIGSFVIILLWSAIFRLDIVSIAEGTVETSSGLQKVQHLEGGIVRELLVKEGDRVKQGQVLVKMEPLQSHSDFGEVDARLTALEADRVRLEAEASNSDTLRFDPGFEQEHSDAVVQATSLFRARRDNLRASIETQHKEITQRQQDSEEIQARLNNSKNRHLLAVEQVQIGEKLLSSELSNRYEQLERLKEANALKSRIEEDQQAIIRAREGVAKARAAMVGIQRKYDEDVRKDLSDVLRQLKEQGNRGVKLKDALARTELRAPMAGVVKTRYVNNVGAVVAAGGTVLDLVPEDNGIIIEVKLPPQDIGFVQVGQKSFVQLSSVEASHFGRIEGKVTYISPDSVSDKENRMTYYVVRILTSQSYFGTASMRYDLTSGVQVTAGIITGSRTVLQYMLAPIQQTAPFALSER